MRRVCRPWLTHPEFDFQLMLVKDILEPVTAYGVVVAEVVLVHRPELHATDARVNGSDAMNIFDHERLLRCFAQDYVLITLVVCLL